MEDSKTSKVAEASIKSNKSETNGKRKLWICLRVLVCIAILWFVISRVDLAEVYQLLTMVSFKVFALVFFIYLVAHFLFVLRWSKILQALQVNTNLRTLLRFQLVGLFFNLFSPTSVGGDVIKAYYVSKDTGKTGKAFLSVFFDRYIGLLTIITFATLATLIVRLSINGVVVYHWVLLIFVVAILLSVLLSTDFAQRLNKLLRTRLMSIQNIISLINESSKITLKNYPVMIWAFLLSLGFLLLVIYINHIYASSIGCPIDIKDLFVFIPLIALATSLPISINGMGLREAAYIYLFSSIGFTDAEALSLALLNFAPLLFISLLGALVYVFAGIGRGKTKMPSYYKADEKGSGG